MIFDRVKAGLAAFVQSVFPRIDYYALYPGTVVVQRGANSIDVQPDNQRLPGISGVPIFLGLPNATVNVQPGARVLVGFMEGDPSKPYVGAWAQGDTNLNLNLVASQVAIGANAALGAARNTDSVQVTLTAAQIALIASPAGACSGGPITLTGNITSASSIVTVA